MTTKKNRPARDIKYEVVFLASDFKSPDIFLSLSLLAGSTLSPMIYSIILL